MIELTEKQVGLLTEARAVLSRGWCQGPLARAGRRATEPYDPRVTHLCLVGAVLRAAGVVGADSDARAVMDALDEEVARFPGQYQEAGTALHYNEQPGRRKPQVLRLMDRVLARHRK